MFQKSFTRKTLNILRTSQCFLNPKGTLPIAKLLLLLLGIRPLKSCFLFYNLETFPHFKSTWTWPRVCLFFIKETKHQHFKTDGSQSGAQEPGRPPSPGTARRQLCLSVGLAAPRLAAVYTEPLALPGCVLGVKAWLCLLQRCRLNMGIIKLNKSIW